MLNSLNVMFIHDWMNKNEFKIFKMLSKKIPSGDSGFSEHTQKSYTRFSQKSWMGKVPALYFHSTNINHASRKKIK